MKDRPTCASSNGHRHAHSASLAVALLSLLLASSARTGVLVTREIPEPDRFAEGILVQPDVGDLEPPSIADEDEGEDDDSGENVPAEIEPERGAIEVRPGAPGGRQEELERPGVRQEQMERGGTRQEDLEMPDGPGVKY